MDYTHITDIPGIYPELLAKCKETGFSMPSDLYIGSLLKTLITSKPASNLLELGTGIGLSLSWMIAGMDNYSKLTTIDNDPSLINLANQYFGKDPRIQILCADGSKWIKNYSGEPFDLIFADAWPGKYSEIDEVLNLVKTGGLYVIDDMMPQPNWPDGHQKKVNKLVNFLEGRDDFNLTIMDWSTGVIVAAKK